MDREAPAVVPMPAGAAEGEGSEGRVAVVELGSELAGAAAAVEPWEMVPTVLRAEPEVTVARVVPAALPADLATLEPVEPLRDPVVAEVRHPLDRVARAALAVPRGTEAVAGAEAEAMMAVTAVLEVTEAEVERPRMAVLGVAVGLQAVAVPGAIKVPASQVSEGSPVDREEIRLDSPRTAAVAVAGWVERSSTTKER